MSSETSIPGIRDPIVDYVYDTNRTSPQITFILHDYTTFYKIAVKKAGDVIIAETGREFHRENLDYE